MAQKVFVSINQQQREIIDELIATGCYGTTVADIMRFALREFCRAEAAAGRLPERCAISEVEPS